MRSDGNSFCGDVVLDSFNMSYRDEDSILVKKYESKYLGIFIMKILNFKVHEENAHNRREPINLGFSATVVLVCIFVSCYKELKSQ